MMLLLVCSAALLSVLAWACGEWIDNRPLRVVGGLMAVVVFSGSAAAFATVKASLSVGMPVTAAFDAYLAAVSEQLRNGNSQFVVDQLSRFRRQVIVTYETDLWVQAVDAQTIQMRDGPAASRSSSD
jgi:ABC-type phosphate/phosphonate transport system substrate-binding protein